MNKKFWIATGVIVLIGVMIGVSIFRTVTAKSPAVETKTVEKEEISSQLIVPGTLELARKQEVYTTVEKGEVEKIHVKKGDKVKKGDLLITFSNPQLELELEQNKLEEQSNYLRINQLNDQLANLKEKKKKLAKEIGKKEAEEQFDQEIEQLETEKKVANLDLKQTLLRKETLQEQLNDLNVKSDINGTVITINENALNTNMPTEQPVLIVGDLNQLESSGLLSEYDALKVKEGQKVLIRSDAVPDEEWEGEVKEISYLPESSPLGTELDNQAVQYTMTVRITSEKMALKPGFQLIMEVETEKKEGLVIPVDALKYESDRTYVYTVEKNKAKKVEVETGIQSGEKIEIIKGLKEGDVVIVNPDDNIQDGTEVTENDQAV